MANPADLNPLLAPLAAANGWQGPLPDHAVEADIAEQVRVLTLNLWDQHAYFAYTDQSGQCASASRSHGGTGVSAARC
jgi:hypothetical protein